MVYKLIDNEPLEQRMTAKVPPRTDPHNPSVQKSCIDVKLPFTLMLVFLVVVQRDLVKWNHPKLM